MRKTAEVSSFNEEMLASIVRALGNLDRAITPRGSGNTLITGNHDASGGYVTSLTEAVMGVTAGLCNIAEAIEQHTAAVKEIQDR